MLIDPFTTVAQIVNFFILILLLKRFLYRPILKAMEQREKKIINCLQEAEIEVKNAQKEAEIYRKKQQKWEELKRKRFEQLKEEVAEQKKVLIANAEEEIEALRTQWYEQLQQEKQTFLESLHQQVNEQIMKIARQAFQNLADSSLEHQMISKFIEGLPNLSQEQIKMTHPLINTEHQCLTISSSFPIDSSQKEQLIQALKNHFHKDINVTFQTTTDRICGIELCNHDYRISWHLDHYLDELEAKMSQLLEGGENATRN